MRIQILTSLVPLWGIACICASGRNHNLAGQYVCESLGSRSCQTDTAVELTDNGNWRWGRYAGSYSVAGGGIITFDGVGGLATWGPAELGPGTLTFRSGEDKVVWRKADSGSTGLAPGVYYCSTAPGGCQTARGIEIVSDGTWSWGASGGSYSIVGGQVIFHGPQLSSWGAAAIGDHKLVFHSRDGDSEWSSTAHHPVSRTGFDPNTFELSCPLQPFERQRVMATIEGTLVPGATNRTRAAAHQQLAGFCRKAGDVERAEQEILKARYWQNGGSR